MRMRTREEGEEVNSGKTQKTTEEEEQEKEGEGSAGSDFNKD